MEVMLFVRYRLICKIEKLHINDPKIYEFWDELTTVLIQNETIKFLDGCLDEKTIDNISSVFADISYKLKSEQFIFVLDNLEKRFPNLLLKHMVQAAKDYFPSKSKQFQTRFLD